MTDHITLDSLDSEVISRLRAEARRRGIEVGKLIAELLASALGTTPPENEKRTSGKRSLSDLAGTWSHEEAEAFLAAIADFEHIDQDMWK